MAGEAGRMPGLTLCMVLPQVFNIFNALGTIAFAYGGHNVVSVWLLFVVIPQQRMSLQEDGHDFVVEITGKTCDG